MPTVEGDMSPEQRGNIKSKWKLFAESVISIASTLSLFPAVFVLHCSRMVPKLATEEGWLDSMELVVGFQRAGVTRR